MEVAVHELAVLPRRDLAAGQRAAGSDQGSLPTPLSTPCCSQQPVLLPQSFHPPARLQNPHLPLALLQTLTGQQKAVGGAEPWPGVPITVTHLPLVPMQQGLPLISQSMWAKPEWLVLVS